MAGLTSPISYRRPSSNPGPHPDFPVPSAWGSAPTITFCHPGFLHSPNEILTLPAYDHPDGGLHHGLAHTACAILACNRFDGYLSLRQRPGRPLQARRDEALLEKKYYFHVPGPIYHPRDEPYLYQVITSFSRWEFPHGELPQEWTERYYENDIGIRHPPAPLMPSPEHPEAITDLPNTACCVTGDLNKSQAVRLVALLRWLLVREMDQYNRHQTPQTDRETDFLDNVLPMRSDIRTAFEADRFCIYPKSSRGFVVHVLGPIEDPVCVRHNTYVLDLPCTSPEFLFARFAYAIFPLATKNFSRAAMMNERAMRGPFFADWVPLWMAEGRHDWFQPRDEAIQMAMAWNNCLHDPEALAFSISQLRRAGTPTVPVSMRNVTGPIYGKAFRRWLAANGESSGTTDDEHLAVDSDSDYDFA